MIAYRLKTSHGFTLIEVLVVLFILASLASVSVVAYQGRMAKVRVDQTTIYIKTLTSAIESYELAVGRFPTTEQGLNALLTPPSDLPNPAKWSGPYLKDNAPTEDPWGSPYQYVCPGTRTRDGFDVWSRGPDGNDGTEDDIGNWTK
jgi:general secretion pathway protein G